MSSSDTVGILSSFVSASRIRETHVALEARRVPAHLVDAGFITYWLSKGKTPLEIATIATIGCRKPDAHLGGTES